MCNTKNISVEYIKEFVNNINLNSSDECKDYRKGVSSLLAHILMETKNYNGFRYLNNDDMKNSDMGKSVGIIFDETDNNKHIFPDYTRRFYK